MRIAICGSMQFAQEMVDASNKLAELGHRAILPKGSKEYASGQKKIEEKWAKTEGDVIKEWYQEIKMSDAVLIINHTKNDTENYVGGNVLIEIAFAHVLDKKIFLLNPIPELRYTEEIQSMIPVILNGDLNKISTYA